MVSLNLSSDLSPRMHIGIPTKANEIFPIDGVPSATVKEQQKLVSDSLNAPLIVGQDMYLLSVQWHTRWNKWCMLQSKVDAVHTMDTASTGGHPGPVDNAILLEDQDEREFRLKPGLLENTDYYLLDSDGWNHLVRWYGLKDNSHMILRKVVVDSGHNPQPHVEVYPKSFYAFTYGKSETGRTIVVSGSWNTIQLLEKVKQVLNVQPDTEARLWAGPDQQQLSQYRLYEMGEERLTLSSIMSELYLMLEVRDDPDMPWPTEQVSKVKDNGSIELPPAYDFEMSEPRSLRPNGSTNSRSVALPSVSYQIYNDPANTSDSRKSTSGATGLYNLGNTCFMNSALQCLSNTVPLLKYFLYGKALKEINKENPLGLGGKMALAFNDLLRRLWYSSDFSFSPRDLKTTISHFAPQFSGYQQHDSQELTGFLLDALHEDLNRILRKPYIEFPENDGSFSESEFADTVWKIHKARNDSIIVDLFQGQFRSTLVCPECSKVSVTFDPFMYLSLPLPITKKTTFRFSLMRLDPRAPIEKHQLVMKAITTIGQAKQIVSDLCKIPSSRLYVTEIFSKKIYKVFSDDELVNDILSNDVIYIYELGSDTIPTTKKLKYGYAFFSQKNDENENEAEGRPGHVHIVVNWGDSVQSARGISYPPFVLTCNPLMKEEEFYHMVLTSLQRFTKIDLRLDPRSQIEGLLADRWLSIHCLTEYSSYPREYHQTLSADEKGDVDLTKQSAIKLCFDHVVQKLLFDDNSSDGETLGSNEAMDDSEKEITLDNCFDEFSKAERLGEEDAWYCPSCKKHQQATKKLDIWKLPDVLVVHLKRFFHSRYHRDKIENVVDFPLAGLELTSRAHGMATNEDAIYDLYAVSNHFGGLGGGHYTAYAKNALDGKWYDFDDSRVSPIKESAVKTKAAYVLYYRRRTLDATFELPSAHLSVCEESVLPLVASPPSPEGSPSYNIFSDRSASPGIGWGSPSNHNTTQLEISRSRIASPTSAIENEKEETLSDTDSIKVNYGTHRAMETE